MRKITHGIIISPSNVTLFRVNLLIYLFKYSLHFFTKNEMIRKISKTKMLSGRPLVFNYPYCPKKRKRN